MSTVSFKYLPNQTAYKLANSKGNCKNRLRLISGMDNLFCVAAERIDSSELSLTEKWFNVLLKDSEGHYYKVNRNSLKKRLGIKAEKFNKKDLQSIVEKKVGNLQECEFGLKGSPEPFKIGGFDAETSLLIVKSIYITTHLIPSTTRRIDSKENQKREIRPLDKPIPCITKEKIDPLVHLDLGSDALTEKQRWKKIKHLMQDQKIREKIIGLYPEIAFMETTDRAHKVWKTNSAYNNILIQALVIKALYRDTHYTFIHGQGLRYWVINQLSKELIKQETKQDLGLFHSLRLLKKGKKATAEDFQKNYVCDVDKGEVLLSVDGGFFNTRFEESAFSFGIANRNICGTHNVLENILIRYLGKKDETLYYKLFNFECEFQKLAQVGNLYAICIPKEKIKQMAYCSISYGTSLSYLNGGKNDLPLLEALQNDDGAKLHERFPEILNCEKKEFPQFRIVMDQINPVDNRIFMLSPVQKDLKDQYKAKIKSIAKEIYSRKIS